MELKLNGKRGGVAIIDEEDYELLSQYSWCKNIDGYPRAHINGKMQKMHKFLINPEKNGLVDHINKIPYDNRKQNLRIATPMINAQNKSVSKNKKSTQYRGVFYDKKHNKFCGRMQINHCNNNIGRFKTAIEAAEAVDMFLVHNKHDHISLNFPEKRDEYLKKEYIPRKNKLRKYKGITKSGNGYMACVTYNNKYIYIGKYQNEIDGAKAFDKYVVEKNIPNRKLNFPEDYPQYTKIMKIKTEYVDTDNENIIRLLIRSRPNVEVYIDKEDYDKIKYYAWCINKNKYVFAVIKERHTNIHRFLTNTTDPEIIIDHIDSNPFNNTKNNLRISDDNKNSRNRKKIANTSSKYIGVLMYKDTKAWASSVVYDNTRIHIAADSCEENAARRRDLYVLDNFPDEHYKLNFVWTPNDIVEWKKKILSMKKTAKEFTQDIINPAIWKMAALIDNNDINKLSKLHTLFSYRMKNRIQEHLDEYFLLIKN